jgi:hypothetical protein
MVEATLSGKMRQIYIVEKTIEIDSVRCTAMDINDNVVVVGNSKGYIRAYEQTWENKTMRVSILEAN